MLALLYRAVTFCIIKYFLKQEGYLLSHPSRLITSAEVVSQDTDYST